MIHCYEKVEITNDQSYEEMGLVLSPTEKVLMKRFKRVVIREKSGRGSYFIQLECPRKYKFIIKIQVKFI